MKHTARYIDSESTDMEDRFQILIRAMSAANELHLALDFPGFEPYEFGYDKGRKYNRVWVFNGTQKFVCFFVDRATGEVWKAGGWKGPALNFPRGTIMTKEGVTALTLGKFNGTHWYHGIG